MFTSEQRRYVDNKMVQSDATAQALFCEHAGGTPHRITVPAHTTRGSARCHEAERHSNKGPLNQNTSVHHAAFQHSRIFLLVQTGHVQTSASLTKEHVTILRGGYRLLFLCGACIFIFTFVFTF